MKYIPQIANILAINGSPTWYTDTPGIQEEISTGIIATTDAEIVSGLNSLPDISIEIPEKGGIGNVDISDIEIIDSSQNNQIAPFFHSGLSSLDEFSYLSAECEKNTDEITVKTGETYNPGDILYFQTETMTVESQAGNAITVKRNQYSCWEETGPENNSYFYYNEPMEQGGCFGINTGGIHLHSGRWVVLYQTETNSLGVWHPPRKLIAGVIDSVEQSGGKWTIKLISALELLKNKINQPQQNIKIKPGFYGNDNELYKFSLYSANNQNFTSDCYLTTFDVADNGKSIVDVLGLSSDIPGGHWPNYGAQAQLRLTNDSFGFRIFATSNLPQDIELVLMKTKLYHIVKGHNLPHFSRWLGGSTGLNTLGVGREGLENTFADIGSTVTLTEPLDLRLNKQYFAILSQQAEKDWIKLLKFKLTSSTQLEILGIYGYKDGIFFETSTVSDVLAGTNIGVKLANYIPYANPVAITKYFLVSTGENINGYSDVLLREQGLGIPREIISVPPASDLPVGQLYIEDEKTFADIIADELKLANKALTWHQGRYRLVEIQNPITATANNTISTSQQMTTRARAVKNYSSPLSHYSVAYSSPLYGKMKYSVTQKSSQILTKGNSLEIESKIIHSLGPDNLILQKMISKLQWLSSDTIRLPLEVDRWTAQKVCPGTAWTFDNYLIRSLSGAGYGDTNIKAVVLGKTEGKISTVNLLIMTARNPLDYRIYAPALEVLLNATYGDDVIAPDWITGVQDECIGFWKLDENQGTPTVIDYSSSFCNGEIINGNSEDLAYADGPLGAGYNLQLLTNPRILFSDFESSPGDVFERGTPFALNFKLVPQNIGATQYLITTRIGSTVGIAVLLSSTGQLYFFAQDSSGNMAGSRSSNLSNDGKYDVTVVYSGGNTATSFEIYINGVEDTTTAYTDTLATSFAGNGDFQIGCYQSSSFPADSVIEHLSIYGSYIDSVLIPDMHSLYNLSKGLITKGLDIGNQTVILKREDNDYEFLMINELNSFQTAGWQDSAGNKCGNSGTIEIIDNGPTSFFTANYTGNIGFIFTSSERAWLILGNYYDN